MPPRILISMIALSAAGIACAAAEHPSVLTLQPTREITAADYTNVLRAWTRKDEIYNRLDSKLFVWATFHSSEFRRAFGLRYTDVYGPGSEEASRLLLTNPEAEELLEFFFSASTARPQLNDFDRETTIWRITLEGDDYEPVDGKVEKIKPTANIRVIYPYVTDFARTYVVRFPRTTPSAKPLITVASKRLALRFRSAFGQATLVWNLQPTSPMVPEEMRRSPAAPPPLPKKEEAPPPPSPPPPPAPTKKSN